MPAQFIAASALTTGATPAMPAHQAGDIILILAMADANNVAPTLSVAQNFAAVTGASQAHNETGSSLDYGGNVFWCRAASGSETAPTLATVSASITLIFRGVIASGNPWDVVVANDHSGGSSTAVTINGGTTTVADVLLVMLATSTAGSASFSGWTNADLTNVTERADVTRDGGTSGTTHTFGVATGFKASAGAFGATTATCATSSKGHRWHIGLISAPEAYTDVTMRGI